MNIHFHKCNAEILIKDVFGNLNFSTQNPARLLLIVMVCSIVSIIQRIAHVRKLSDMFGNLKTDNIINPYAHAPKFPEILGIIYLSVNMNLDITKKLLILAASKFPKILGLSIYLTVNVNLDIT